MNARTGALLALPLLTIAVSVQAATHRLAYSKAEKVEVFVDHADGQPWCSDALKLRFVFDGEVEQAAVDRLLPKLGGLMRSQCPAATALSWTATTPSSAAALTGTANRANDWAAQQATAPATDAVASKTPAPEPAAPREVPAQDIANAVAEATSPAKPTEPAPAPSPASDTATKQAEPAITAAPQSLPTEENTQVAPATEPTSEQPDASPVAKPFSVAGWQPEAPEAVFAKADFLNEIADQNSCRFRLAFTPKDGLANVTLRSTDTACGPDGYAQGKGRFELIRRDGVRVHSFNGTFINGLAIHGKAAQLPVVGMAANHDLYLLLHSEPASKVHYLIRLQFQRYGGHWSGGSASLVGLTENRDLFRELDSIRLTLDLATAYLTQKAPEIGAIEFVGVRDLDKALQAHDRDYWLYEIGLNRHYRTKQWEYNPARAQNHLFAFERKEAERQRQAEAERERKAQLERQLAGRQAEQRLQLYEQMQDQARDPQMLYRQLLTDAGYTPFGGGGYGAMMRGGEQTYSQIVHIDGKADGGWTLDYPYAAELEADEKQPALDEGWFLVKGKARLDSTRKDEQGLPLTRITAASVQPCEKDGCTDLLDPLALVRHQIGDPEWTPELARQRIEQAWPERAAQQGDNQ